MLRVAVGKTLMEGVGDLEVLIQYVLVAVLLADPVAVFRESVFAAVKVRVGVGDSVPERVGELVPDRRV